MMKVVAAALVLTAAGLPCLAQDAPREAFKQQEQSLDAPPPAPRGSLYMQKPAVVEGDATAAAGDATPVSHSMSFIEVPKGEQKQYHKHDIVTIVVSEDSQSSTTGTGDSKKTQAFDAALQNFVKLGSTNAGLPSVQSQTNSNSLPEVKYNYSNDRENTASQARTDSLTARIAATIVDIKPNGTLVLEATKQIKNDKEVQIFRLTGICKAASINNNSVVSTDIAELSLAKTTSGEVSSGTKSGWLNSFMDKVSPF